MNGTAITPNGTARKTGRAEGMSRERAGRTESAANAAFSV
jgi:hypothetical protein